MDFIDLKKQYQIIKPSVARRINEILDAQALSWERKFPS